MKVALTEFIQLKVVWSSISSDHSVSVTHHQQEEVQRSPRNGPSVAADRGSAYRHGVHLLAGVCADLIYIHYSCETLFLALYVILL